MYQPFSFLSLRLVCYFFVFTTFWRHLWSITEQTHGNNDGIYLLNGCTWKVWRAQKMHKSSATLATWVLSKLPKCIHNDICTTKSRSRLFYNIAGKNGCFFINCKILVTCKTITNASFGWLKTHHNRVVFKNENSLRKTEKENKLIYSLTINGN